jgi:ABC-2 type transport system permease protein
LYASAVGSILVRDFLLFKSYPTRFVSHVLAIFLSVSLFYYVSRLVSGNQFGDPAEYFEFVVVGLVTLEVLTATLSITPISLRGELVAGTFERLATSALGPIASIVAMMFFPTLLALVGSIITVALAAIVFGLSLNWPLALLALPTGALGAFAFLPFAMLLCAAVLRVKQAGSGAAFLVSALSIAGGAMFPTGLLPEWLQWISEVQPLTPALELMRWELVGAPLGEPAAEAFAKLIGFALVLVPVGLYALRSAVNTCRARGTLMEY